jgi:hypothetical protein
MNPLTSMFAISSHETTKGVNSSRYRLSCTIENMEHRKGRSKSAVDIDPEGDRERGRVEKGRERMGESKLV